MIKQRPINVINKVICLVTASLFLFNQVAFANPGAGIEIALRGEKPGFLQVQIPANLATLDDIFEAPPSTDPKLVLHIRDAHANCPRRVHFRAPVAHEYVPMAIRVVRN